MSSVTLKVAKYLKILSGVEYCLILFSYSMILRSLNPTLALPPAEGDRSRESSSSSSSSASRESAAEAGDSALAPLVKRSRMNWTRVKSLNTIDRTV